MSTPDILEEEGIPTQVGPLSLKNRLIIERARERGIDRFVRELRFWEDPKLSEYEAKLLQQREIVGSLEIG